MWLWGDSFDSYVTAGLAGHGWALSTFGSSGAGQSIGAFGRNGTQGLRVTTGPGNAGTSGSAVFSQTFAPGAGAACILGFAFKTNVGTGKTATICFVNGSAGTPQLSVCLTAAGVLAVYRGGSTGTLIATGTNTIALGATNYIELKVIPHTTAGSYELRINGVTELSGSGINTAAAGTNDWTQVGLGNYTVSGTYTGALWDYDDFYLLNNAGTDNNDFLGSIRLVARLVDAAGNYSQFTPSAGANWQNVRDTSPDADATFNSSITPGQIDTYGLAAVAVAGIVKAVQVTLTVRSNAAGTETIAPVVRIAGVDYVGATIVGLATSYTGKLATYERSPATAAPWTIAEIDAAEFGLKLVS
jgi:hypothetical protein